MDASSPVLVPILENPHLDSPLSLSLTSSSSPSLVADADANEVTYASVKDNDGKSSGGASASKKVGIMVVI